MSQQHRYTSPETVTKNVARVDRIMVLPNHAEPQVEILYLIGEESGGVFTERAKASVVVKYAALPASFVALLDGAESKALQYGVSQDILPSGSVEPVLAPPEPVSDP